MALLRLLRLRRGIAALFVSTTVVVVTTACGLITGAGDLQVGPEQDGAVVPGDETTTTTTTPVADSGVINSNDDGSTPITDTGSPFQPIDAAPTDGCAETGCFDMPAGFSLVAFGASKNAACPSGFAAGVNTVENLSVGPGGCGCNCTTTNLPSCQSGQVGNRFDNIPGVSACDNVGGDYVNMNGACRTDGFKGPFGVDSDHRFTPPPATGGTCSGSANKNGMKLNIGSEGRICQASSLPQCNGKVCPPTLTGTPLGVCIAKQGNVACPTTDFTQKHLIGDVASFQCAETCGCSGVTASCKGTMRYFATPDCSGGVSFSVPVTDVCLPTDNLGAPNYLAYRYVADPPTNVVCTATGQTTATTSLGQMSTVCCKP